MKKYNKIIIEISIIILLIAIILGIYFFTRKDIFITLNGNKNMSININEEYKDSGIKVLYCGKYIKFKCIDITKNVTQKSNVDVKNKGDYLVTYNISYKGINKKIERKVKVSDKIAPVITLVSNEVTSYTCPNKDYIEEGYTVTDNYDTDLTDKVIITKSDDGWTYTVTDSSGNTGSAFREYKYNDVINPSINLKGYSTKYVEVGKKFVDPGYTATDNCDGDITSKVIVSGDVDVNTEGTYTLTYKVSDNKGNESTVTRNVRVYIKKTYNDVNPEGKVIYLTFDDGPCIYTTRLLEILDYYNVKATFFVTNQISGYRHLIKEEYERGHSIGLHTYSHVFGDIYSSFDGYFNDIDAIEKIVFEETGMHPNLIRFAGGSSNTVSCGTKGLIPMIVNEFEARGYKYFDWNVGSNDTSTTDKQKIVNNVINGIGNKQYSVVLQHDLKPNSIEAVAQIIEWGQANGYTFLPLTTESPTVHSKISSCHY